MPGLLAKRASNNILKGQSSYVWLPGLHDTDCRGRDGLPVHCQGRGGGCPAANITEVCGVRMLCTQAVAHPTHFCHRLQLGTLLQAHGKDVAVCPCRGDLYHKAQAAIYKCSST